MSSSTSVPGALPRLPEHPFALEKALRYSRGARPPLFVVTRAAPRHRPEATARSPPRPPRSSPASSGCCGKRPARGPPRVPPRVRRRHLHVRRVHAFGRPSSRSRVPRRRALLRGRHQAPSPPPVAVGAPVGRIRATDRPCSARYPGTKASARITFLSSSVPVRRTIVYCAVPPVARVRHPLRAILRARRVRGRGRDRGRGRGSPPHPPGTPPGGRRRAHDSGIVQRWPRYRFRVVVASPREGRGERRGRRRFRPSVPRPRPSPPRARRAARFISGTASGRASLFRDHPRSNRTRGARGRRGYPRAKNSSCPARRTASILPHRGRTGPSRSNGVPSPFPDAVGTPPSSRNASADVWESPRDDVDERSDDVDESRRRRREIRRCPPLARFRSRPPAVDRPGRARALRASRRVRGRARSLIASLRKGVRRRVGAVRSVG